MHECPPLYVIVVGIRHMDLNADLTLAVYYILRIDPDNPVPKTRPIWWPRLKAARSLSKQDQAIDFRIRHG